MLDKSNPLPDTVISVPPSMGPIDGVNAITVGPDANVNSIGLDCITSEEVISDFNTSTGFKSLTKMYSSFPVAGIIV